MLTSLCSHHHADDGLVSRTQRILNAAKKIATVTMFVPSTEKGTRRELCEAGAVSSPVRGTDATPDQDEAHLETSLATTTDNSTVVGNQVPITHAVIQSAFIRCSSGNVS